MGLIRLLGIGLIIYAAIRLVSRYVLPFLARYVLNKASKSMQEKMRSQTEGKKVYQEGEVEIRKTASDKPKQDSDDKGEYVDFEEV